MYRALKAAQNDMYSTLLKFSDDIIQINDSRHVEHTHATTHATTHDYTQLENAIHLLNSKQDIQFRVLNLALDTLNQNMTKIVTILMEQGKTTITTATVIPSLQPVGTKDELQNICNMPVELSQDNSAVDELEVAEEAEDELELDELQAQHEAEAAEDELELDEVAEDDSPQDESPQDESPQDESPQDKAEDEVELDESPQDEVVEEEGIEVEEWTYKGRVLFKDTENTVYMNDSGEIGDAIGRYDPVKNILKKLV